MLNNLPMKRLNSLILATCLLFGSGFALKAPPASAESVNNSSTMGNVKAEGDIAPETLSQKLNLSTAQKKQIAKIFAESNPKIVSILNTDQRKKLEASLKAKEPMRSALQSLNLTADQRKKIGEIVKVRREQLKAVLTPEQRKKFEEAFAPMKK
ncbi:MAG: hypothetical protein DCF20_02545 [Pseudanabaena sp.]|nr:MAG: hypothetical protein DCF20_02545 [Pseudanabaena sp.]